MITCNRNRDTIITRISEEKKITERPIKIYIPKINNYKF